jgi:hypothetical protein
MKLTIHKFGNALIARDEAGRTQAIRRTACNPAAIDQIIIDADLLFAEIDWENSEVEKPTEQTN